MLLKEIVFSIVFDQTIAMVLTAIIFPKLTVTLLIGITTFTLPAIAFFSGAGIMVYLLSITVSSNIGGEGPAFFGIIGIMFVLPLLL